MWHAICLVQLRVDAQSNAPITPQTHTAKSISARPNIIHIIIDDIGYDDFSSYGSLYYKTPHIDALAKEGTILTNFYAPHGTCTPTRAAIMTGRYSPRVNDRTGLGVLFPTDTKGLDSSREITFTKQLQKVGYATALVGKWHLGHLPKFLPPAHGFDSYVGIPYPNDHGPERLGNTGSRAYPPIPLMRGTEKVKDLNNNDLAEIPAQFIREACAFIKEKAASKQPFYLQYSNIETHTPYFIPKGFEGRSSHGAYGDAVAYIDYTVGVLMGYLKQVGLEKNTLIVIHADNGPLVEKYPELEDSYGKFGLVDTSLQHKLRDGKYQQRFEGGVRSACFIKWPGVINAGAVNQNIYSGVDLFTSFLQVAGAETPTGRVIDGKPMIESIITNKPVRNTFYAFAPQKEVQGVRYNNWKLVLDKRAGKNTLLLFNLAVDAKEKNNIASNNQHIVDALYALALQAQKAIEENKPLLETNSFNF
jgi:arylsulfatase A-like enzyme